MVKSTEMEQLMNYVFGIQAALENLYHMREKIVETYGNEFIVDVYTSQQMRREMEYYLTFLN